MRRRGPHITAEDAHGPPSNENTWRVRLTARDVFITVYGVQSIHVEVAVPISLVQLQVDRPSKSLIFYNCTRRAVGGVQVPARIDPGSSNEPVGVFQRVLGPLKGMCIAAGDRTGDAIRHAQVRGQGTRDRDIVVAGEVPRNR